MDVTWQNKPVPQFPEPHPERQSDTAEKGHFKLHAASVRGRKHKHDGTNRDDYYAYGLTEHFAALCVCDGAGSKPFSRIGAKIASEAAAACFTCEQITEQTVKNLAADTSEQAFTEAVSAVAALLRDTAVTAAKAVETAASSRCEEDPESYSADVSDYSSTFLTALIIPLENGDTLVACISVGDGNIAAFGNDGESIRILGVGTHGDWSGETEFLQSEGVLTDTALKARTRIIREPITRVVLATDGVADDYFPNETEFSRLNCDIDEHKENLADWLDTYYVRGSFDDRTLVVLDM